MTSQSWAFRRENGRKLFDVPSQCLVVNLSADKLSTDIIEACRLGDRDAFRALYELYKDRVYSISLYFFHGDAVVASDITQEVFLKVIASIRQFRGDAEFSTWLYRLVVNACMDADRGRKSDAVVVDRSRIEAFPAPDSQEQEYERAEMTKSVRAAVSALAPKFRVAVLLRYFEDLSYEQMAKALHCSIGTVGSRLSRGHKLLAERLRGLTGTKG
jgi:RNA polymerase sigma-70 factor, ECF subfamily